MKHHPIRTIKIWQLIIAVIILVPLSGYLLRQNNLRMLELRDKVVQIDQDTGDFEKVKPHLEKLGSYVMSHMNADLDRLELPGLYNTAVERIRKEVARSGNVNSEIYRKAQQVCENPNVMLTVRAQCIQDYVTERAEPGTTVKQLEFPDKGLYTYSFASPEWSLDAAGLSLLALVASALLLFGKLVRRFVFPGVNHWIDEDPLE